MRIYIPTMGRPRQRTVEALPNAVLKKYKVSLVCPNDEVAGLATRYGSLVSIYGTKVRGIAATRQYMLDHCRAMDEPIILMLDDDLPAWSVRPDPTKGVYRRATPEDLIEHFKYFELNMREYAHGSIGHRLFANAKPPLYYNSRMLRALAYNTKLMPKTARFRIPVMEDFDMTLQLLAAGKPSVTYNVLVQDQYGTNLSGGCSSYRTQEVQAAAAQELAKRWPDFVTVVEKPKPKKGWDGVGNRLDVRVNWAKAAKAGGATP